MDQFEGGFKSLADGVNAVVNSHIQDTAGFVAVMDQLGRGDLSVEFEPLPGKKK